MNSAKSHDTNVITCRIANPKFKFSALQYLLSVRFCEVATPPHVETIQHPCIISQTLIGTSLKRRFHSLRPCPFSINRLISHLGVVYPRIAFKSIGYGRI